MIGNFIVRRWFSTSAVAHCGAIRRECVGGVCRLVTPTSAKPATAQRFPASRLSSSAASRGLAPRQRKASWSKLNAVMQSARSASTSSSGAAIAEDELRKRMDEISEKFAEALEMINDAKTSFGTVYFSEDMNDAKELVESVLSLFQSLVERADEGTRKKVQATIGLKIEELKAQMNLLHDMIKDS